MTSPVAVDSSALCRTCGICCGWTLFGAVGLVGEEIGWAVSRRLPLAQRGDEVSFRLPCSVLKTEGNDRVCGDYTRRPQVCRAFRCKLLKRYENGEVPLDHAVAVVKKTRALITSIEERVANAPGAGDFATKLSRLADVVTQGGSAAGAAPDADALLDVGVLRAVLRRDFHQPAKPSVSSDDLAQLVARSTDPSAWDAIFDAPASAPPTPGMVIAASEESMMEIRTEAYTRVGTVLTAEEAALLAARVESVLRAGWPPVFVFLDAAVWDLPRRIEPWLTGVLGEGYELLNAVWAWSLGAGSLARGWPPHRDRSSITTQPDGTPDSVTVWIALTDATPENGCMYVLPPSHDPYYRAHLEIAAVHDVQNVRALPARAGSALAWNHQLLHWGGRSSSRARDPRVSLAFEFRRPGKSDEKKTIDRGRIPAFEERVKIVAEQIVQYQHLSELGARYIDLATRLLGR